jgi:hypothetical protein
MDASARGLPRRRIALPSVLAAAGLMISATALLAQPDCVQEAASIRRAQSQLPRLEVAPPGDQQIVCITLETNILFARRVAAHVARCPRSPLGRDGNAWQRTGADYTAQFGDRRCKPAIRGFGS